MVIKGKVLRLPDRVSGDIILPAVYARLPAKVMLEHVLEGLSSELPKKIAMSQIIVAGEGSGCGTGRESSATVLKEAGIRAIVSDWKFLLRVSSREVKMTPLTRYQPTPESLREPSEQANRPCPPFAGPNGIR